MWSVYDFLVEQHDEEFLEQPLEQGEASVEMTARVMPERISRKFASCGPESSENQPHSPGLPPEIRIVSPD